MSHVFFNSGFYFERIAELTESVPDAETLIMIDGYHAFMALPVDIAPLADRAFYMAGGIDEVVTKAEEIKAKNV